MQKILFSVMNTVNRHHAGRINSWYADTTVKEVLIKHHAIVLDTRLRRTGFSTVATEWAEKTELRMLAESAKQAIVVLAETPYYEYLESAEKVWKYKKQRNIAQLPESVKNIIKNHQNEAER